MKGYRVKKLFLEELAKIPIVEVARAKVNISRQTISVWRKKDDDFARLMEEALHEGDSIINDMAESVLISKIRDSNWSATRYRLDRLHPKYKKDDVYSRKIHKKEEKLRQEELDKQKKKEEWNLYLNTPTSRELDDETIRRLGLS